MSGFLPLDPWLAPGQIPEGDRFRGRNCLRMQGIVSARRHQASGARNGYR